MSCTALTDCLVMPGALTTSAQNDDSTPFVEIGNASTAFVIVCAALAMVMTPAVGLLYSGFSRSHHALSIILICCLCYAVVSIQWVIWGFSLGFSETSTSPFIGNLDWAGLEDVSWNGLPLTAPAIPAIAFSLFQLQFATVTVALIFGSVIDPNFPADQVKITLVATGISNFRQKTQLPPRQATREPEKRVAPESPQPKAPSSDSRDVRDQRPIRPASATPPPPLPAANPPRSGSPLAGGRRGDDSAQRPYEENPNIMIPPGLRDDLRRKN